MRNFVVILLRGIIDKEIIEEKILNFVAVKNILIEKYA